MKSLEKINAVVDELGRTSPGELAPDVRDMVVNYQALCGVADLAGIHLPPNPIAMVLPDDPVECDILLDKLLALLHALRGDDLPPFDPTMYGEGVIAELIASVRGRA